MANPLEALQGTLGGAMGQFKAALGPLGDIYGKTMDAVQASPLGQMFHGMMQPNQQQASTFQQNMPFMQPGASNFNTTLPPLQESQFQGWLGQNKIPFNANSGAPNYDMRGLFSGLMSGHPQAQGFDPSSGVFPHYWTTPFHSSFSNKSQWAGPNAPAPTGKGWLGDG